MKNWDIKCPRCGKVVAHSNFHLAGMSALQCTTCRIRFDIKATSTSRDTGRYTCTNIRKM